jgi:6-phosphogluconolactonase
VLNTPSDIAKFVQKNESRQVNQTIVCHSQTSSIQTIVESLCEYIYATLAKKPFCTLALCGGRSAQAVCELLAKKTLPWNSIHIFTIDERLVPLSDPQSNFLLIKKSLIDLIDIPHKNVHPYTTSVQYTQELKELGGTFDVIFLSSGEDGHVAGIYPKHLLHEYVSRPLSIDSPLFIEFFDSPKLPKERMSAIPYLITQAKVVLFFSEQKKDAYAIFQTTTDPKECPACYVKQTTHTIIRQR